MSGSPKTVEVWGHRISVGACRRAIQAMRDGMLGTAQLRAEAAFAAAVRDARSRRKGLEDDKVLAALDAALEDCIAVDATVQLENTNRGRGL